MCHGCRFFVRRVRITVADSRGPGSGLLVQNRKFFGVPGVEAQDQAISESQEPIYDRTQERLGCSDIAIIRIRKCLMDAAVELRECGTPPPGLEPASHLIRPASVLLPTDVPWVDGAREQLVARPVVPSSSL